MTELQTRLRKMTRSELEELSEAVISSLSLEAIQQNDTLHAIRAELQSRRAAIWRAKK
jgi:hypothetical protein